MANSFHVAVLPGEGVGVEVTAAALQVLDAVERRFGIALRQERIEGGALYYKEHGTTLEPDGMRRAGAADAMLFGAMGWPEIRFPDGTEITPQIDIRGEYNLFAGVRPIRAIPGVPVALADPRATTIDLVRRPWEFDVLPMENLFGDILSDLGAGLIGGMGFAPSADIGEAHGLFQPSHGTAPDIAGKGVANPTAAILSAAMMLEWLGTTRSSQACQDAAAAIERAVDAAFGTQGLRTSDVGGTTGTQAVADAVAGLIGSGAADPA